MVIEGVNCIIIHGSPSRPENNPKERTYDKHWMPWSKKELEKRGIKTEIPLMPTPWKPRYNLWKKEFEKQEISENTILIGHSAGGGFLVRWLGETRRKIKKLILVAPAIIHSGRYKRLDDVLKFDINKDIKDFAGEIIIFVSDNDSKGILKSVDILSEALSIKPIILKGRGHFTSSAMKPLEFPELIDAVSK